MTNNTKYFSHSKAGDWPELPSRLAETRCLPDAKGQPTADSRCRGALQTLSR
ncbi:hypothetical protein I7I50_05706 [Histoplasma capsulatum G186AR]|nr:hypothetical protein I7I52_03966 [Histoplasma capsulatum]QSS76302.1 hypothetical protein I7I50_05706 [Histoplasma capsulatum G186AR]